MFVCSLWICGRDMTCYDKSGRTIGRIDVPERPTQLLFGGPDRGTLFIFTHHALYAVKTKTPGVKYTW